MPRRHPHLEAVPVTPSLTRRCARLSPGLPARRIFCDLATTLPRRGFLPLARRRTSVSPADPPAPGSRPGWLGVLCGPLHQLRSAAPGRGPRLLVRCLCRCSLRTLGIMGGSRGVVNLKTRNPHRNPEHSQEIPKRRPVMHSAITVWRRFGGSERPDQASQWPRSTITRRSTEGRSVMMPSTPMSRRRCISAGSSMVQTWTATS